MRWLNYNIIPFLNSLPASDEFCRLLIIFASSLDLDQAQQYLGPDLDPIPFGILIVYMKKYVEKFQFEKYLQTTKNHEKLPSMQ